MKIYILVSIAAVLSTGCAQNSPSPTDLTYEHATRSLRIAKEAVYSIPGAWYPNTLLGTIGSFHAISMTGRLFLTDDRMLFAAYDDAENKYVLTYEQSYSRIGWVSVSEHGVSRIVKLHSDNTIHSFAYTEAMTGDGKAVNKDDVLRFISKKVPKKSE